MDSLILPVHCTWTHFMIVPTVPLLVVVMTREVRERSKSTTASPKRLATPSTLTFDPAVTLLPPEVKYRIVY